MSDVNDSILTELFTTYDLVIDQDLLNEWFVHDPHCLLTSPSFPTISELHKWMVANRRIIEKELR